MAENPHQEIFIRDGELVVIWEDKKGEAVHSRVAYTPQQCSNLAAILTKRGYKILGFSEDDQTKEGRYARPWSNREDKSDIAEIFERSDFLRGGV